MESFIETIKVLDGRFYNLEYHERRAKVTTLAFWGKPIIWNVEQMAGSGGYVFGIGEMPGIV